MILLSPFLFTHWLSMTSLLVLGGEEGAAKSGEWELWGEEEQSQARGLPNLRQVRGGFQGLVVQGRETDGELAGVGDQISIIYRSNGHVKQPLHLCG